MNQIFVLLGHNGAGKTTTISILTGLLNYTKGMIKVFGQDQSENLESIRKSLGVCPQHDILYDDLTVYEHLDLFSNFKGCDQSKKKEEIMKMITDLGLNEKTHERAKSLSGGQKRRLSVGIALIGDSKFIILDEPTSGMDTSARRHIWEMLKNYRNGRIILLTTHFMDEADNLGDRIAIMSQGQLKCVGSSVFLKNKFGVGYNLIVSKNNSDTNDKIKDFISQVIPESIQLSSVSREELFQLPLSTIDKFQELFEKMDSNLNELDIESYGISITTLEEVFLKIAQDSHQLDKRKSTINHSENVVSSQPKEQELEMMNLQKKPVEY